MKTTHAVINIGRRFEHSADALFAHWISEETRQRWEAGPDTGMVYENFDTRDGGVETVRIVQDGQEVGSMIQSIYAFEPGKRIAYSVVGSFNGEVTTLMTVVVEFKSDGPNATHLESKALVADLTGKDVQGTHEAGWDWILDRFAKDIEEHGLVGA